MAYSPPKYPSQIPTQTGVDPDLPDKTDDIDWLMAVWFNAIKKELCAIMTELGTLLKGSCADLKTRLAVGINDDGTLKPTYVKSIMPLPATVQAMFYAGANYDDNTIAHFGKIILPFAIKANHLSVWVDDIGLVNSTFKIALYAEDGQSKVLEFTTPTISATGLHTFNLAAETEIPAGSYYVGIIQVTDGVVAAFNLWTIASSSLPNATTNEAKYIGAMLGVTAGTLPATFNPKTDLTAADYELIIIRLDN